MAIFSADKLARRRMADEDGDVLEVMRLEHIQRSLDRSYTRPEVLWTGG
jgi:hypothetical protein